VGGIPAVVVMRPVGEGAEAASEQVPARDANDQLIDQFGLTFSPALLVVTVGTPITFTNSEGALTHNVHLRSIDRDESVFDEDANSGDAIRATLGEPGGYDVLCDMHPGMSAFVFATDAPYAVFADADGRFDFGRVPPGTYAIRTWTRDVGYGPTDTVSVTRTFTEVDLAGLR
jgi:plastocyanin